MGKGSDEPEESGYEKSLSKIAEQLYSQTQPLRGRLIRQMGNITSGQTTPQQTALFKPIFSQAKQGIEDQYGVAREDILSTLPRGGTQQKGLTDLAIGRAEQSSALPSQISGEILNDMLSKAYGVAFGTPQTSISGLGTAAGTYGAKQSQAMASESQEAAAKWGGLGTGLGLLLASDRRLKTNIKFICQIDGINIYSFNYLPIKGLPKEKQIGVMAQDLLKTLPEAVIELNDVYFVNYIKLPTTVLGAIQMYREVG